MELLLLWLLTVILDFISIFERDYIPLYGDVKSQQLPSDQMHSLISAPVPVNLLGTF